MVVLSADELDAAAATELEDDVAAATLELDELVLAATGATYGIGSI